MPLFKNSCKEKPWGNNRPVSVIGKLLDSIPRDKIYMHLARQRLIRDSQHGFAFFEAVTKMVDEDIVLDIVCMNFNKIFNKAC